MVEVRLSAEGVRAGSALVSEAERVVTISGSGTFRLSGRLDGARLVVDSAGPGAVTLVLDGASVFAPAGPALLVVAAERVVLRLAEGSSNTLYSGGGPPEGQPDAALFSRAPLSLEGAGHLLVLSRSAHGLVSERDLALQDGVITVIAPDDGIRAENLTVSGGDLLVFAANDALKSTGEEEGSGLVLLSGGSLDLVAGGDGVQAERALRLLGGSISVVSGGGHGVAPGEASTKGLKAERELLMGGGVVGVDASGHARPADGALLGPVAARVPATAPDPVAAAASVTVSGRRLEFLASREGRGAPRVTISGWTLRVHRSADALNAAGDAPRRQ